MADQKFLSVETVNAGRRALFAKIGSAALALPFLHEFERQARAADPLPAGAGPKVAKNLIVFFSPNGVYHQNYWPIGGGTDFKLNVAMEPLEKYKDKLIVVGPQFAAGDRKPMAGTGLKHLVRNMGAGGNPPQHQAQVFLTGDPVRVGYGQQRGDGLTVRTGHPSLDQIVANKVGTKTRFKSLEFGLHPVGGDTPSTINFAMDGSPLPRMTSSPAAWNRVFQGIADSPKGGDGPVAMGPEKRQVAVSNFISRRFASLSPRLGREDRMALEGHMQAIREVEARLFTPMAAPAAACAPSKVNLAEVPNGQAFAEVPATAKNFQSMIALAFACDLTRVATVTFGYPGGGGVGGLHPVWLGFGDAHHAMSHHGNSPDKTGKLTKLMNWFGLQVAQTLDELAKYQHPEGGSLLDHTLVFWGSRHGEGNGHTNENIPALMAGGMGGAFGPTGRVLNLPGTNWCNLLLSMARGFGVDLPSFGLGPLKTTETIKELGV
jgi:hypothetical protein